MDFTRLFEILEYQQLRYPQQVALAGREQGAWNMRSTADLLADRDRLSAGLLHIGLHKGDRVGMLTHCGSPQWAIADAAMLQIGIIPVPIHSTSRPDEIVHIVRDSGLRGCFVSNAAMSEKIEAAGVLLEFVFSFEDQEISDGVTVSHPVTGSHPPIPVIAWNSLLHEPDQHDLDKIRYIRDGIKENDLATLLYTSGTTGQPKGVMLTHANIVSNVKSVLAIVPVGPEVTAVSFLPLSHIFERMVTYVYQAAGTPVWYADAVENLPRILPEVRPQIMTAVPRILERMHERLLEERNRGGTLKRKIMDWAIALGERFPYSGERAMPVDYRFKRMLADLLVFRHWRKRMGGRIRFIAVGSAALQPRLGRLFSAARIDVREGYGLTETSPVIAFNRFEPGGVHFGTVGIPAPGMEVRLAVPDEQGDGEIEVRGPNVMAGYYNLPDETAARFTADGWFKTGDLGKFEFKRFLKITGRKSEIFKTTTGKFVAPAFVEQQLMLSPFISQAMAVGLNQPFVAALIVPNFAVLEEWCKANNIHWTSPQFMVLNPKVE
ncbi:MAG TPA: long-chain fatty acid--CoA ligase, partial [Saprospiraceae bacterium]|nr:long-chain fatty acid--CoA ligase [Saprospiraceae bacterium]